MRIATALPLATSVLVTLLGCRRVPATVVEPEAEPASPPAVVVEQPPTAAPASEPSRSSAEPEPTTLASFESFLGLRFGDTREQVVARHGQPPYSEPDSDLDTWYFVMTMDTDPADGPPGVYDDFLFVVTIDNTNNRVFNIQANEGDYAAAGIDDPLVRLIGTPLSEVVEMFGEPLASHAGFNTYSYVDETRGVAIDIEFVCYDHNDYICSEIWVTWTEP